MTFKDPYQWPVGFGPVDMKRGELRRFAKVLERDFLISHAIAPTCKISPFTLPKALVKKGEELAFDVVSLEDQRVVVVVIGAVEGPP